jgi:NADH-quinone oxidoreductase subunit N
MTMATMPNIIPALPELFLAGVIMLLLMFGVFQKGGIKDNDVAAFNIVSMLSMVSLILAVFLLIPITAPRITTFADMFVIDVFAVFSKSLVLVAAAFGILMSRDFMERHHIARFEFPILILFAALGMMLMISANDLISLYVGLEMQSLSLYVMAAIQRDDERATEAGLKYFVLGAVASGLLLYGASLVYGFAGTTNFDALAVLFNGGETSTGVVIGIVFILAGLSFKVSAVPFHMWTPDVYEGAPTPVTAFFAVAPKIAALALFLRVMIGPFGGLIEHWQQIIVLVSILSMALGAFAAINQRNIKRLMAYSSIGHVGYALVGLAAGTEIGVRGVLIYLSIYLVMNIGTFACILCMRRGGRMVEEIDDLAGLGKTHPLLAATLVVFMFSLAGIPPLAGFFGKLYVFLAAIESGLYLLAILGVIASVVGAFYYLRIIKIMYFDEALDALDKPIGRDLSAVIGVSALIIILFFAYPGPVINSAQAAAKALFAG